MLYAVVFTCGAALMGLELVAARVLAPFLGNSIYVWGSVISVVMVALSIGYWAGGQLADRWGPSRVLGPVIAASGLSTVAAPLIADAVLPLAAELGPRAGSLAAATVIFFTPSVLIATVSPLGVRLAASRGLDRIGRSAGGLYAISTGGSIVGTLATAFWLIPLLSIEPLIVWTGFLLLAASFGALGLREKEPDASPAPGETPRGSRNGGLTTAASTTLLAVAAVALGSFVLIDIAPAPAENSFGETVLFQQDTQYHRIFVTEDSETRHLRFDRSHQSAISLEDPFVSEIAYPDYMHLALALQPDAQRVLVLGLGGGAITKRFWRDYPDMTVDTVEIDPVVVDVAERYFGLPQDERLRIFVSDGRHYVQNCAETYDVIIVDAYYADSLPFHLTTLEFLGELNACMEPNGVLAYNVISAPEGGDSELFRSMYRTASEVWRGLWVFPIGYGETHLATRRTNMIVLASDAPVSDEMILSRIADRCDGAVTVPGYESFANDLYTGIVKVSDVPLLTDSHAPTDSLINVN